MPPEFTPRPITLTGSHVRLEPLDHRHASDLFQAARDPEIWRYLSWPPVEALDDIERWIDAAGRESAAGRHVAFATVLRETGAAIGSTRFLAIRAEHRGLEIGWTWLAPEHQRTAANTEAKYLLLRHAFETLDALRVEFKTDRLNERSQRAIERIGGRRDGMFPQHMIMPDGRIRDSVYYSIVRDDWPAVRIALETRLSTT